MTSFFLLQIEPLFSPGYVQELLSKHFQNFRRKYLIFSCQWQKRQNQRIKETFPRQDCLVPLFVEIFIIYLVCQVMTGGSCRLSACLGRPNYYFVLATWRHLHRHKTMPRTNRICHCCRVKVKKLSSKSL